MKKILLSLLFLITWISNAQVYPVQVTPQLIPPYSMKLTDYEQMSNEKLFVNLLLTDINEVNRQVRLKMFIEGPGINVQTVDFVQGAQPIFLDGGINLQLSNLDLRPYFRLENLMGISPQQYNDYLPEGSYQFCFQVFDFNTGQVISRKSCAQAFLILNDPPFLNLPYNNDLVAAKDPQNIVFSWTPRHINATNVTYEFTLKEIIDTENTDPQIAFAGGLLLHQTELNNTTLVYGPAEMPLMEGKTYAWQVRAFVSDGINETSLFKNNGYSEIYVFQYIANCPPPSNIMSEAIDAETEHITWNASPEHLHYRIQYRKQGAEEWFEQDAYNEEVFIRNLEAEETYEFRVGAQCMEGAGFSYSPVYQFQMPSQDAQASYNCGLPPPDINTSNQEPLPQLRVKETFNAGDFSVKVTEVSGSNGVFTGKGMIVFNLIKSLSGITDTSPINIAVEFENIHINTDYELTEGFVKTTYDPTWGDIADSNAITDNLFGGNGEVNEYDAGNIDIDEIQVDTTTSINNVTLIDSNGNSHTITTELPVVIHGDNNETWVIDEEGNYSQVPTAEGGAATAQNTNGISNNGSVTQISSTDVTVVFNPGGYYSTDQLRNTGSSDFKAEYDTIPIAGSGNYNVLYKLISDHPQATDQLTATLTLSNGKTTDDIVFKTRTGIRPDTVTWSGNTAHLRFKKRFNFGKEQILATVKPADSTQNYDIAGKMNLWHAKQDTVNVTLILVGNAQISNADKETVKAIYQKAGIWVEFFPEQNLTVSAGDWDLDGNNQMDTGDSSLLSHYTAEEKALINYYKNNGNYTHDMFYIFVLDNSMPPSESGLQGFMPLKHQFGFVFNPANPAKTIAHELGHGAFKLKHPFSEYNNFVEGSSDLLMDYGNGTEFSHMDWQKMHAPGVFPLYIYQGDEEGEFKPWDRFNGVEFTVKEIINPNGNLSFVSPAGIIITLPNTAKDFSFANGYLLRFTTNELDSVGDYIRYSAMKKVNSSRFVGYKYKLNSNNPYIDNITSTLNQNQLYVFIGLKDNNVNTCNDKYKLYKVKYNRQMTNNNNDGTADTNEASYLSQNISVVDISPAIIDTTQKVEYDYTGKLFNCLNNSDLKVLYKYIENKFPNFSHLDEMMQKLEQFQCVSVKGLFEDTNLCVNPDKIENLDIKDEASLLFFYNSLENYVSHHSNNITNIKFQINLLFEGKSLFDFSNIKELFECVLNWDTSFQPESSYIPVCLWKDYSFLKYTPTDLALLSGIADGGVNTVVDIKNLIISLDKLNEAYTTGLINLSQQEIEMELTNVIRPLNEIAQNISTDVILLSIPDQIQDIASKLGDWAAAYKKIQKSINTSVATQVALAEMLLQLRETAPEDFSILDRTLRKITKLGNYTTQELQETRTQFKKTLEFLANLTDPTNNNIRNQIGTQLKQAFEEYLVSLYGTSNVSRYQQGKIVFEIISAIITDGAALEASLSKILLKFENLSADFIKLATKLAVKISDNGIGLAIKKSELFLDNIKIAKILRQNNKGILHLEIPHLPTGIDESLVTSRGGFLDDVEYILADGTTGRGKVEFVEHNGNKYVRLVNSSYDALLTKFSGKNSLITWINTFHPANDAHILDNIYNAFSSLDNTALTRLNTALQKTGGQIYTEFGELLVKLSEGNTQILARISGSGWENKLPQLVDDLANAPPFKTKLLEKPELVEAWGNISHRRADLRTNIDALEALSNLKRNPKLAQYNITDEILGNMKGWGVGNDGVSYKQVCDKVNELIDNLPDNVTGLEKYLGAQGFGNGLNYTNRHAWVQLERLLEIKQILKNADEIIFERKIQNIVNGTTYTSYTDTYFKIGLETFEIETKAGIKFFTTAASNSSNFAKQSFNSLKNVNKLENYKVFLNPEILSDLDNPAKFATYKNNVINAWKNWEGGALLQDISIREKFTEFAKVELNNPSLGIFTKQQLETFLNSNDNWFSLIFVENIKIN